MANIQVEKLNPETDIRDYYLFWYPDVPKNCNQSFVGEIRNSTNEKLIIGLRVDDEWMYDQHQRNCTLFVDVKAYINNSFIILTSDYFEAVRNDDSLISFLWHEIGHFHTNRYFPEYAGPNQSKLRNEYIANEKVYPAETVADLMAAYYSGKDYLIAALRKGARERLEQAKFGDENASKAWWEYRMRRKAIQEIDNDDEIENEICRLCGVNTIENV